MTGKLLTVLKKNKESGVSMMEYALLAALIAVACITAMGFLGSAIDTKFSYVAGQISGA